MCAARQLARQPGRPGCGTPRPASSDTLVEPLPGWGGVFPPVCWAHSVQGAMTKVEHMAHFAQLSWRCRRAGSPPFTIAFAGAPNLSASALRNEVDTGQEAMMVPIPHSVVASRCTSGVCAASCGRCKLRICLLILPLMLRFMIFTML